MTDLDVSTFSGIVPLFPLAGTVLFPQMTLPLHIFEPRYRRMTADALQGEKLIALAMPLGGSADPGRAPLREMTCLGKIVVHEQLADGRFNLMLRGIIRAVIVEEVTADLPYRSARVELYRDMLPREPVIDRSRRFRELVLGLRRLFQHLDADALTARLLESELPLGQLCDLISPLLRSELTVRQELLEEVDADLRSDLLLMAIRRELSAIDQASPPVYPPAFSLN